MMTVTTDALPVLVKGSRGPFMWSQRNPSYLNHKCTTVLFCPWHFVFCTQHCGTSTTTHGKIGKKE